MSSDILKALAVSANGMRTQGTRIRVISENVANANTTGDAPGADPYRRQTISFENEMDRASGMRMVKVGEIGEDFETPFPTRFIPDHPAADAEGYVKMPNVNPLIEIMDVREAQRTYQANLGMIEQARSMFLRTVDLLRA